MKNELAFSGGAFDPPHLAHIAIARQILTEGRADSVHMGPSGIRPDKAYTVSNEHRRRMMEILVEEQNDLPRESLVANFHFIDAAREQSATHGVHKWFASEYRIIPRQVFGTDVIPNIHKFWMHPEWVKQKASKLFVPRGDTPVDYSGLDNYSVMPFLAHEKLIRLSSSLVREQIPEGDFTGLSEGVAEYILRKGLYLPPPSTNTISLHVPDAHKKPDTPLRFVVPDEYIQWERDFSEYQPTEFTDQHVVDEFDLKGADGWADDQRLPEKVDIEFHSYTGPLKRDGQGRPLNPRGRTGISGRGVLGKWGANFAADPIITRNNPQTGQLELLVILRDDVLEWALPGGMSDYGEFASATARRELGEEAGLDIDFSHAPIVYQGYVDDPRNTDNAWMETTAVHVHLTDEEARTLKPVAGDDAADYDWMPLIDEKIDTLYANHSEFVRAMMQQFHSPENREMTLQVVTAPDAVPESPLPKVFLAGSIENDTAVNWQQQFVTELAQTPCLMMNPRRKIWDSTWSQDGNPFLENQIKWELDCIEKADLVCFYFDPDTRSPIALLELGLCRNKPNVHICCPPGFWRRDNVLVTSRHLGYTIHEEMGSLMDVIKKHSQ